MADTGTTSGGPVPWPAPAAPAAPRRSRGRNLAVLVGVLLVLGCLGGATFAGIRVLRDTQPPVARGLAGQTVPPGTKATPGSGAEPDAVTGPRPSSYPVREADDLKRVCDQWYYPKATKATKSGTQPISIFAADSKDFDTRTKETLFDIPDWYTPKKQKAWDPSAPGKVRLVACVDLTSSGKKLKTCTFDEPKVQKFPMREATYRLTLYEVATGRKVLQKTLKGEDDKCPVVVLLGADRTVYSAVGDRQYYELLRKYVEK